MSNVNYSGKGKALAFLQDILVLYMIHPNSAQLLTNSFHGVSERLCILISTYHFNNSDMQMPYDAMQILGQRMSSPKPYKNFLFLSLMLILQLV